LLQVIHLNALFCPETTHLLYNATYLNASVLTITGGASGFEIRYTVGFRMSNNCTVGFLFAKQALLL
ncbi:MAG: hypothetical protein WAP56_06555, partial [Acetivibrionales bacterium]